MDHSNVYLHKGNTKINLKIKWDPEGAFFDVTINRYNFMQVFFTN